MTEPPLMSPLAEGAIIGRKYRVERVLGAGGMGVVIAARHLELDERVAIKLLLPEAAANPEAVARFAREAKASVRIKNEHVARTLDVGQLDDGAPYMVMEYLEGQDLAARLARSGPLAWEQVVGFAMDTCEALADAHTLGIIHRDLKPANLFIVRKTDGTECVKVLDFGISKQLSNTGLELSMTRTATLMGSPFYMSPEQMASAKGVDARSDIWSLGITLFELLAGVPPFQATTITELCAQVLTVAPPSLRTFRPDLPPGFEVLVNRCLAREPAQRFQNVAELAAALAPFGPHYLRQDAERVSRVLGMRGASEPPAAPRAATGPTGPNRQPGAISSSTAAPWADTRNLPSHRNRAGLWSGLVVFVLLLGGGGLVTYRWMRSGAPGVPSALGSVGGLPLPVVVRNAAVQPLASSNATVVAVAPVATASTAALATPPRSTKAQVRASGASSPLQPVASVPPVAQPSAAPPSTAATTKASRSLRDYGGRKY